MNFKIIEIQILTLALIFSQVATAHNPGSRSVVWQPAITNGPDINRAGYGWLNASSEVEAETYFHDLCPARRGQTQPGVCVPDNDLLTARMRDNFTWPSLESAFVDTAQEKVYEHIAMQAAAMGKPIPDPPSCLRYNSRVQATKTFATNNASKSEATLATEIQTLGTGLANHTTTTPLNDRKKMEQLIKLRSVKASFSPKRMAQAFLLERSLTGAEGRRCAGTSDRDQLACLNIRREKDRIRRAFPLIYNGGVLKDEMFGDNITSIEETPDACGRNSRQRFELSIYQIMGAHGSSSSISSLSSSCGELTGTTMLESDSSSSKRTLVNSSACRALEDTEQRRLTCRGAGRVRSSLGTDSGYSTVVSWSASNPGIFDQAIQAMNVSTGDDTTSTVVVPAHQSSRLIDAGGNFTTAIEDMETRYARTLGYHLRALCDGTTTTLGGLMSRHPQAVQQAMLDMPAASRDAVKAMMCKMPSETSPYFERFQRYSQSHSCRGVTPQADGSTQVNRTSWGWPYAGTTNYSISNDPDGTRVINVPIQFTPTCDTYLSGLPAATGSGATIGNNLPAAVRTNLMNLSDANGNGTVDAGEFNYFQLAGMNCANQATFANNRITGANGWVTSSNQRWNAQAAALAPPITPGVRVNIQRCCTSGCARTCPAGVKNINVTACSNADTGGTRCDQVSGSNRESEESYSFAQSNNTTWHEMGHAMGLQDEYRDPNYPAHALGETGRTTAAGCGSTMGSQSGSANGSCEQIHRRHFLEILRPAELGCQNPPNQGPADRGF